jgi:hypothetical protein
MVVTIGEVYKKAVKIGMEHDPRGRKGLAVYMKEEKEKFKKLTKNQQKLHEDRKWNPYDDTRVIFGKADRKVHVVYVSIDAEAPEVGIVGLFNQKRVAEGKKPVDLILTHHPESYALPGLVGVMDDINADKLAKLGISPVLGAGLTAERISDIAMSIHSGNIHRVRNAARLLDIPMMCAHTIADNVAHTVVESVINKLKPRRVKEVVEAIREIPHFKKAEEDYDQPVEVHAGSEGAYAGKVVMEGFTGGTDTAENIVEHLARAGVGTAIAMHKSKKHREEANKHKINFVVCNHMVSDSIGMQPLVDWLRDQKIEIVVGAGFMDAKLPKY